MNRNPSFWQINPSKLELLVVLRNQAMSCGQIGMRLECSRNAVIGKLARMGIPSLYHGRGTPDRLSYHPPKPKPLHKPNSVRVNGNNNLSAPKLSKNDICRARPVSESGKGRLITDLLAHECKFAVGFNKSGQHLFCSQPTDNSSWCPVHRERVWKTRAGE